MLKMVTRQQWNAKPATSHTPIKPSGIAVHYTANAVDATGDPKQRMRDIQTYHMSPGGHDPTMPWADIAYNFAFTHTGTILEGRGWWNRSAAQGTNDGNDNYIAIVFLGTDKNGRDDVTRAGRAALGEFIRYAQNSIYHRSMDVQPHSHFHSTGCPGDELRSFIAMKGWVVTPKFQYPKNFFKWAAWYLGEGDYSELGPRHKGYRPAGVPAPLTPVYWAALKHFLAQRKSK